MPVGAGTRYFCQDEERRAALERAIAAGVGVNGIDFLEVLDSELVGTPAEASRQHILLIQCFRDGLGAITTENIRIEGGVRITPVHVDFVAVLSAISAAAPVEIPANVRAVLSAYRVGELDRDRILVVGTEERGDFSTYRLSLVQVGEVTPLSGFDPRLSSVEFSFKVECPADFDCKNPKVCAPEPLVEPEIDYLAKDYASFRRLMFDRLSTIIPQWQERNPADMGVMLVELLAYVADQLSYAQDAAATEEYLGTARQRISVRRHARLTDYFVGEGANARTWIAFEIDDGSNADGATLEAPRPGVPGTILLTRLAGRPTGLSTADVGPAVRAGSAVFETMTGVTLHASLNQLQFYSWSNRNCCLPVGATRVTLLGNHPELVAGRFVLFQEMVGPKTGSAYDADPTHRQVVGITGVETGTDPVEQVAVTEITWDRADALQFPLCLSSETDAEHGSAFLPDVSALWGNVVAADHGHTVVEDLKPVPERAETFRPRLDLGSLVHAALLPSGTFAASVLARYTAAEANPAARLTTLSGEVWLPRRDLLSSDAFSQEFVAEIENDGRAILRFGDEVNGRRPAAGTIFAATYRVGTPLEGSVGAEAIAHIADAPSGIRTVRNPLPSFGFVVPESLDEVRRYAPEAFRTQERAVTADDYARAAERHPEIQRAVARFRWTGSWYTVFVSLDRKSGLPVDAPFITEIKNHLNQFRMAGFDLEIRPPRFVALDLALHVCVAPGYLRSAVKQALLEVLSNRTLVTGTNGFFHPDNWTFGQTVYLSQIYEKVAAVAGVAAVTVTRLQRFGRPAGTEIADGFLLIGEQEISLLDNDPSLRENGRIEIELEGGI